MSSPFSPLWAVKYPTFGQKLPIRIAHHTFLESRHAEVIKNTYYVVSPEWSHKKISAHGLIPKDPLLIKLDVHINIYKN